MARPLEYQSVYWWARSLFVDCLWCNSPLDQLELEGSLLFYGTCFTGSRVVTGEAVNCCCVSSRSRQCIYDERQQSTTATAPLNKAAAGVCTLYVRYILNKQVNGSGRQ